jgi:hypothetical protein
MKYVLTLLVVVVATGLAYLLRRRSSSTQRGASSSIAAAVDGDAATLRALEKVGADLTKPRELEFFLYFPSEQSARSAASQMEADFVVEVSPPAEGSIWLVLAKNTLVPKREVIAEIGNRFSALASRYGGKYDGWGSPVA